MKKRRQAGEGEGTSRLPVTHVKSAVARKEARRLPTYPRKQGCEDALGPALYGPSSWGPRLLLE